MQTKRTAAISQKPSKNGFTLAELLIALAILGVIAVFTIPKILQSEQDSRKRAIFKETIAAIMGAINEDRQNGTTLTNHVRFGAGLSPHLNLIKYCGWEVGNPGSNCFTEPVNGVYPNAWCHSLGSAYIFASGMIVCGPGNGWYDTVADQRVFYLDWNGPTGPNLFGNDQLELSLCYDQDMSSTCRAGCWQTSRGFAFEPNFCEGSNGPNHQLLNWIYQN